MKMKMEKGWIYIVDVDNVQGSVLKSWTQLFGGTGNGCSGKAVYVSSYWISSHSSFAP